MTFYIILESLIKRKIMTAKRKDFYIYMMNGYSEGVIADDLQIYIHGLKKGDSIIHAPYLAMRNSNGVVMPYVPTQEDLFADDWEILL